MSSKSARGHRNQETESRRLDHDLIEQRALQIARIEGREEISQEHRKRAEEELFAPNETAEAPEITPDMEPQITAWDEAPASSGKRAVKVLPEDEASIGQDLTEKGMRIPNQIP